LYQFSNFIFGSVNSWTARLKLTNKQFHLSGAIDKYEKTWVKISLGIIRNDKSGVVASIFVVHVLFF